MRLLRPRFTMSTLLVLVAIAAIGINRLRPIGPAEAERIAEAKFLSIPGVDRWAGLYRVRAGPAGTFVSDRPARYGDGWTVVVSDPKDGALIMQVCLTAGGKTRAVDFSPGKFNEMAPPTLPGKSRSATSPPESPRP